MTADDPFGRLDDGHSACTMGQTTETLGTTRGHLPATGEAA
ncbi:hypothetical protein ACGFS9_30705 [Streptomyces sp. NPDC048566]